MSIALLQNAAGILAAPLTPARGDFAFRAVMAMAWADWLERVRTTRFVVTLLIIMALAWYALPPNGANYATMSLGSHRGVYNSAWIGALVGLLTNAFLSLAGFYLVKNPIERDRQTGVGQVLAATPMSSRAYLLGKWLSNCGVLFSMVAVLMAGAAIMQAVRAESTDYNLLTLFSTMALLSLPTMSLVAALAVLFETVPGLRGSLGNVVYFFLWVTSLSVSSATSGSTLARTDVIGMATVQPSMLAACARAFPDFDPAREGVSMGIRVGGKGETMGFTTFEWPGVEWTASRVAGRLVFFLPALMLVLLVSAWFDRFDVAIRPPRPGWLRRPAVAGVAAIGNATDAAAAPADTRAASAFLGAVPSRPKVHSPAELAAPVRGPAFATLLRAELMLLVKGHRWWSYAILGVCAILLAALPTSAARFPLLPIVWILPLLVWSPLGTRERTFNTAPVLFSAPSPVIRQLAAAWLAGALLAIAPTAGLLIRLAVTGHFDVVAAILVGAAFIPAFALASGIWSGSRKLFEVVYLVLWYAILNNASALDFMGATPGAIASGKPLQVAIVTIVLLALAVVGRTRAVRGER